MDCSNGSKMNSKKRTHLIEQINEDSMTLTLPTKINKDRRHLTLPTKIFFCSNDSKTTIQNYFGLATAAIANKITNLNLNKDDNASKFRKMI